MKFRILFLWVLLFSISISNGQDFKKQRAQLAAFNVGFNGLVAGVGSWINKSENDNFWTSFSRGFYKGAIGGGISHVGFTLTSQIQKQRSLSYAWPARMVNSFGASIIQNAAENRPMLDRLHFNLYLTRLEYFPKRKKFKARIFTSSIYGVIVTGKNARLDLKKSLQSGVIYFRSNGNFSNSLVESRATGQVSSVGMWDDLLKANDEYYEIFAHEIAHILQFDRKVGLNPMFVKLDSKFKDKSNWYRTVSKYVYFDLNGPVFYWAYSLQSDTHNCNFFEQEAENYSNDRFYGCSYY